MKPILLLAISFVLAFTSCQKDKSANNIQKQNIINSFTLNYSTAIERSKKIEELSIKLINTIYFRENFDPEYQIVGAMLEDDKQKKKITLKYGFMTIGNMNIDELAASVMAQNFIKTSSTTTDSHSKDHTTTTYSNKEKIKHTCNGGKFNGETLTLDRPTSITSAYKYGKAVAKFSEKCLDNGGCLTVCKVKMTISMNENLLLTLEERKEYGNLLDSTGYLLLDEMDKQ